MIKKVLKEAFMSKFITQIFFSWTLCKIECSIRMCTNFHQIKYIDQNTIFSCLDTLPAMLIWKTVDIPALPSGILELGHFQSRYIISSRATNSVKWIYLLEECPLDVNRTSCISKPESTRKPLTSSKLIEENDFIY